MLLTFAAAPENPWLEMKIFRSERFSVIDPTLSNSCHHDSSAGFGLSVPFQGDVKIQGVSGQE